MAETSHIQDGHCVLCNGPLETDFHLACPFARAIWNQITTWERFDGVDGTQILNYTAAEWWENTLRQVPRERKRAFNGLTIYTLWNI
jgi:hypothetical protein